MLVLRYVLIVIFVGFYMVFRRSFYIRFIFSCFAYVVEVDQKNGWREGERGGCNSFRINMA